MPSTAASNNVVTAITRCFASGEFADITIKCGHFSWKAHRLVVCSQSPVLYKALEGSFLEANSKEINLEDDNPEMVNLMLAFLYTTNYDYDPKSSEIPPLQLHAQMHSLADKYQIPGLIHVAKTKYSHALQGMPRLEDYLRSVPEVYVAQASGNELRKVVVQFARRYLRQYMKQDSIKMSLREVIEQVPQYSFDIVQAFIEAPLRGDCHTCGPDQEAETLQARCLKCGRGGVNKTY